MKSKIILSIIVPCYNSELYLPEFLKCISRQLNPKVEIILINDGSFDKTGKIIDEFANSHANVKIINQKNSGVSSARNVGIENSIGEYVYFCDSDDLVNNNFISVLLPLLDNNIDLLMFYYNTFSNTNELFVDENISDGNLSVLDCSMAYKYVCFEKDVSGYLWNKCFKLSIIKENNIRFKSDIHILEDQVFVIQYLEYAQNIKIYNKALYYYRLNMNGALLGGNYNKLISAIKGHHEVFNIINKKMTDEYYKQLYWERLINCCFYTLKNSFIRKGIKNRKKLIKESLKVYSENKKMFKTKSKKLKIKMIILNTLNIFY